MSASRRMALIAGLWFAGTFVFSIPAFFFYDPVLNDADYILGAGADTRTAFGAFLELLTALEVLWEASLAIYLIVKGFRPSPILPDDPRSVPQLS